MDTLRAIEAFAHSVDSGSLSAAARTLGITQPTISKLVMQLEHELGVRLLRRNAAGLSTTEEGQRFYERAKRILEDYEEAVVDVRAGIQQPRGLLRVSAPVTLGQRHLNTMAIEFLKRYPDIQLELLLDDRFIDPQEARIDVSLRLGDALPQNLVGRHLATWPRVLVASPAYIAARGLPDTPMQLLNHDYLRYAAGDDGLLLQGPDGLLTVPVQSRYRVNNAIALFDSVIIGAGISLQPTWMVAEQLTLGQLVRVLPSYTGPVQKAHLLYAPRRHQPLRVRVLVDFLSAWIGRLPGIDTPS